MNRKRDYLRTPRALLALLVLFAAGLALAGCDFLPFLPGHGDADKVVRVAPPTGDPATDRASIEAAIAEAEEGAVIKFAPGTYVIGTGITGAPFPSQTIEIPVPGVTLLGHPHGTILRGGDTGPETVFGEFAGLMLLGGEQTVRNITFKDFSSAGVFLGEILTPSEPGGYLVEDCTFLNSAIGVAVFAQSPDVSRIRNNRFINVGIPLDLYGKTVAFTHNEISAPEPENVPVFGQPFNAGQVAGLGSIGPCENNLFAHNTVHGNADGFIIGAFNGGTCRNNVIRDNVMTAQRAFTEFDASTLAWLSDVDGTGTVEDNVIVGNRLLGSDGVGIIIEGATRTTIRENEIAHVATRPDSEFDPFFLGEESVNRSGTGVWVTETSSENSIVENTFRNVESYEVVLEGDQNLVVTTDEEDVVLDLGMENQVLGPGQVVTTDSTTQAIVQAPAALQQQEKKQTKVEMLVNHWRRARH